MQIPNEVLEKDKSVRPPASKTKTVRSPRPVVPVFPVPFPDFRHSGLPRNLPFL